MQPDRDRDIIHGKHNDVMHPPDTLRYLLFAIQHGNFDEKFRRELESVKQKAPAILPQLLFASIKHMRPKVVEYLLNEGVDPNNDQIENLVTCEKQGSFSPEFYTPIRYAKELYDFSNKCIGSNKKILRIIEFLLNRPSVVPSFIEKWLSFYQIWYRSYDCVQQQLLDFVVSHLIANNISKLPINWLDHYRALHNDFPLNIQESKGKCGQQHEFTLSVRIAGIFSKLVENKGQQNSELSINPLKKELLVELEALRWLDDLKAIPDDLNVIQKYKNNEPNAVYEIDGVNYIRKLPPKVKSAVVSIHMKACYRIILDTIIEKLAKLKHGDEYILPTGWKQPPHAVCICLTRIKDKIVLRVDNSEPPEKFADDEWTPSPYILGQVEYSALITKKVHHLKSYISNIIYLTKLLYSNTIKVHDRAAIELIYNETSEAINFTPVPSDIRFPKIKRQIGNNCYVMCFAPGLLYRTKLNKINVFIEASERSYVASKVEQLQLNSNELENTPLDYFYDLRIFLKHHYHKKLVQITGRDESETSLISLIKKTNEQSTSYITSQIETYQLDDLFSNQKFLPCVIHSLESMEMDLSVSVVNQWLSEQMDDKWLFWISMNDLIKYHSCFDATTWDRVIAQILFGLSQLPDTVYKYFKFKRQEGKIFWLLDECIMINQYPKLLEWLEKYFLSKNRLIIVNIAANKAPNIFYGFQNLETVTQQRELKSPSLVNIYTAPTITNSLMRRKSRIISNIKNHNSKFSGREYEKTILKNKFQKSNLSSINQQSSFAITGLGGVGKSALAIQFCLDYISEIVFYNKTSYQVVWFCRAETKKQIRNDLFDLAIRLNQEGIILPSIKVEGETIDMVVNELILRLTQLDNWILIYDNVMNQELIEQFLPQLGNSDHGFILITTRNLDINCCPSIQLRPLHEDIKAAVSVLWQYKNNCKLQAENQISKVELSNLNNVAELLGCLPLALVQAGSHMRATGMSTEDYILEFKRDHLALLSEQLCPNDYPESVLTTWKMNFARLSLEAKKFLGAISYLAPELQPRWFWSVYYNKDENLLGKLIRELKLYSLISVDLRHGKTYLQCHRLVQQIVRDQHEHTFRQEIIRKLVLILMKKSETTEVEQAKSPLAAEHRRYELQSHWETISGHILKSEIVTGEIGYQISFWQGYIAEEQGDLLQAEDEYKKAIFYLNGLDEKNNSLRYARTLMQLGNVYCSQWKSDIGESKLKDALQIYESQLEENDLRLAIIYVNFGCALSLNRDLKRNKELIKLKNYLRKAYLIQKSKLNVDHPSLAHTLENLGNAINLEQPEKAVKYLRKAYKIKKQHFGAEHAKMCSTLRSLAYAYSNLEGYEPSVHYYKKAYLIASKCFGANHPDTLVIIANLAWGSLQLNKESEAETYFKLIVQAEEKNGACHYTPYAHYLLVKQKYKDARYYLLKTINNGKFMIRLVYDTRDNFKWIDSTLHEEIKKYGIIKFSSFIMAYYFLLRSESMLSQEKNASKHFHEGFANHLQKFEEIITEEASPELYRLLGYFYRSIHDNVKEKDCFAKAEKIVKKSRVSKKAYLKYI